MQGSRDVDRRGAKPRVRGKADERGGHSRSGKKVAGGGMEAGNPAGAPAAFPQSEGKDETARRGNNQGHVRDMPMFVRKKYLSLLPRK